MPAIAAPACREPGLQPVGPQGLESDPGKKQFPFQTARPGGQAPGNRGARHHRLLLPAPPGARKRSSRGWGPHASLPAASVLWTSRTRTAQTLGPETGPEHASRRTAPGPVHAWLQHRPTSKLDRRKRRPLTPRPDRDRAESPGPSWMTPQGGDLPRTSGEAAPRLPREGRGSRRPTPSQFSSRSLPHSGKVEVRAREPAQCTQAPQGGKKTPRPQLLSHISPRGRIFDSRDSRRSEGAPAESPWT